MIAKKGAIRSGDYLHNSLNACIDFVVKGHTLVGMENPLETEHVVC